MLLAMMAELAVWSVLWAWVFERGARSMTVALALHVGAHLDNLYRLRRAGDPVGAVGAG